MQASPQILKAEVIKAVALSEKGTGRDEARLSPREIVAG